MVSQSIISLRLSPNPASKTSNIYKGLQNKQTTVSVVSAAGVVMKTLQSNNSDKVVQLDISSLISGVYAIKVIYKQFVKL